MKKFTIIILISLLAVITFATIIFFIPDKKTSDTSIFVNDTANGRDKVINESSTSQVDFIESQPPKLKSKIAVVDNNYIIQRLSDYVDSFELGGENTSSIITANDKKTQEKILEFSDMIARDILDNSNISDKDRQKLLWNLYNKKDWKGKDNAFKAVVSDALLSIDLSDILPEIIDVYKQSLTLGDENINERSNLIRIVSNNFEKNSDIVNELYLEQIQSASTTKEVQELAEHALMRYVEDNTTEIIKKNIGSITNIADSDEIKASLYIETMLISAVNSPENTDVVFNELFNIPLGSFTTKALNESLLFQLSEDRNFNITDISPQNLNLIRNYIDRQNLSDGDWTVVKNRIDTVLNNSSQNQ